MLRKKDITKDSSALIGKNIQNNFTKIYELLKFGLISFFRYLFPQ